MTAKIIKPSKIAATKNGHLPVSSQRVSRPSLGSLPAGTSAGADLPTEATVTIAGQAAHATEAMPMNEAQMLDAYWGSYGTDSERAALLRSKTAPVMEVVIGTDDRQQVGNTSEYPWHCIASLRITAADGSGWIGTGWLVGPRILLTAGHVVYMEDHGGWAQQIEVIPGRNADDFPFGSVIATDFRSVQGWTRDRDSAFDYGVILLPNEHRLGDQLGWFGYQVRPESELGSFTVNISGYPGDKPTGTQWWMSGTVKSVSDRTFSYDIDTAGGQSGAPVWIFLDGDGGRYGVGIHTNGAQSGNSATRMIQEVFDNVARWSGEVP